MFLITLALLFLSACNGQNVKNASLDMDEAEFEEFFHLDPVTDSDEFEKKQNALKASEAEIKQVNQDFAEGKKTWYDHLNDFSNLPKDEFIKQKTGLIEPSPEEKANDSSAKYFARFKRNTVPDEYNAVTEGLVSPIKFQGSCGSCAAFAAMSSIETCFKKITGIFGDYSEQQMLDCAYGSENGAYGCNGATPAAYLTWAGDNEIEFASETVYPYQSSVGTCPDEIEPLNQGAKVSGSYYTYNGDEDMLKNLVYEHGAVLVAIHVDGGLQNYGGGIYSGCSAGATINHAVSVVGYGTEDGKDYWLFKNSWGTWWGEEGFGKIERGVNMCTIGPYIATTECTSSSTECSDSIRWCRFYTPDYCTHPWIMARCQQSCSLC